MERNVNAGLDLTEIEKLKKRLACITKVKISKEKCVLKLRNTERALCGEIQGAKAEIDFLTEQLEDLKDKISDTAYQNSKNEITKAAERSKLESRCDDLRAHKNKFAVMFDRERKLSELRNKEIREKEAEELELERLQKTRVDEENELRAREAAAVEQECHAVERECIILKKRNNAIMLKLCRKLVDSENTRRELLKNMGLSNEHHVEIKQ